MSSKTDEPSTIMKKEKKSKVPKKSPANKTEPTESLEDEEKQTKDAYKLKARYFAENLISLIIPVSLTMLLVISMQIFVKARANEKKMDSYLLTPYQTPADTGQVVINVLCILGAIILMTCLVVLCVYFDCAWCLFVTLGFTLFMVMFFVAWTQFLRVIKAFNVALDWITVMFILYNYGVVGMVCLFWKSPVKMKQCYTCVNCAMIAIMYIDAMHESTIWGLLAVLVLWDIFAVLTPCGPLNILVKLLKEKGHLKEIPPGLVYSTMVWLMADKKSGKSSKNKKKTKNAEEPKAGETNEEKEIAEEEEGEEIVEEEEEDHGVHLGLGDFIFYSLLIGKAADPTLAVGDTDWNTIISCYNVILIGLVSTVIILIIFERALPALPISLTLGLIFYFLTSIIITPFSTRLSLQVAFI